MDNSPQDPTRFEKRQSGSESVAVRMLLLVLLLAAAAAGTPLDDYVNAPDAHYNWVDLVGGRENAGR